MLEPWLGSGKLTRCQLGMGMNGNSGLVDSGDTNLSPVSSCTVHCVLSVLYVNTLCFGWPLHGNEMK